MSKCFRTQKASSYKPSKCNTKKNYNNKIPASKVIYGKPKPNYLICPPSPPPAITLETDYSHYNIEPDNITCTKTAFQKANVSVPVVIKPYSYAGPTTTLCCNNPTIKNIRCTGTTEQVCYFTITQEICIEVPIYFGAEAFMGMPLIDCLGVTFDNCGCD